jgi:hypothetical protein
VQARRDGSSWTIELAVPRKVLGLTGPRGGVVRMQVALSVTGADGAESIYYLAPQPDPRLLPHRYALLAVPAAGPGAAAGSPAGRGRL